MCSIQLNEKWTVFTLGRFKGVFLGLLYKEDRDGAGGRGEVLFGILPFPCPGFASRLNVRPPDSETNRQVPRSSLIHLEALAK